jgi:hypothetical protein
MIFFSEKIQRLIIIQSIFYPGNLILSKIKMKSQISILIINLAEYQNVHFKIYLIIYAKK